MKLIQILIIGIMIMLVAGCVKTEEPEPEQTPMPTSEPQPEPEPVFQGIEVGLSEWAITPSSMSAEAGSIKFMVSNNGDFYHEFRIEGPEFEYEIEDGVPAGASKEVEVQLEAGTYKIVCPIPGHEEKGMVAQLVVS